MAKMTTGQKVGMIGVLAASAFSGALADRVLFRADNAGKDDAGVINKIDSTVKSLNEIKTGYEASLKRNAELEQQISKFDTITFGDLQFKRVDSDK